MVHWNAAGFFRCHLINITGPIVWSQVVSSIPPPVHAWWSITGRRSLYVTGCCSVTGGLNFFQCNQNRQASLKWIRIPVFSLCFCSKYSLRLVSVWSKFSVDASCCLSVSKMPHCSERSLTPYSLLMLSENTLKNLWLPLLFQAVHIWDWWRVGLHISWSGSLHLHSNLSTVPRHFCNCNWLLKTLLNTCPEV